MTDSRATYAATGLRQAEIDCQRRKSFACWLPNSKTDHIGYETEHYDIHRRAHAEKFSVQHNHLRLMAAESGNLFAHTEKLRRHRLLTGGINGRLGIPNA